MAMLDWSQRLLPREEKFFSLFERHAASIAAAALRRMLDGGAEITQHCRAMMQYEEEADAVTRDVLIAWQRPPPDSGARPLPEGERPGFWRLISSPCLPCHRRASAAPPSPSWAAPPPSLPW